MGFVINVKNQKKIISSSFVYVGWYNAFVTRTFHILLNENKRYVSNHLSQECKHSKFSWKQIKYSKIRFNTNEIQVAIIQIKYKLQINWLENAVVTELN